jgi:hypothetical protein
MESRVRCAFASNTCYYTWIGGFSRLFFVWIACTIALIIPFYNSLGLSPKPRVIVGEDRLSIMIFIIPLVYILSVALGNARKHENELWCVLDTLSIHGLFFAIILYTK